MKFKTLEFYLILHLVFHSLTLCKTIESKVENIESEPGEINEIQNLEKYHNQNKNRKILRRARQTDAVIDTNNGGGIYKIDRSTIHINLDKLKKDEFKLLKE
jgi:hypothetical protein